MHRTACLICVFSVLLCALAFPAFSEENVFISSVPDNFPSLYTPILLDGIEGTVYAFNNQEGITEFRRYGSLNGKSGFYPGKVEAGEEENTFIWTFISDQPLTGNVSVYGGILVKKADKLPSGFYYGPKKSVYMLNIFGQAERYIYGTYDGTHNAWYPADTSGDPVKGSLAVSLEDAQMRQLKGEEKQTLPAHLKKGFRKVLEINLNGEFYWVYSAYPAIDSEEETVTSTTVQTRIQQGAPPAPVSAEEEKPETGAQNSHRIQLSLSMTREICKPGESTLIRAGITFLGEAESEEMSYRLAVLDENGNALYESDRSFPRPLRFIVPQPGVYRVVACAASGADMAVATQIIVCEE